MSDKKAPAFFYVNLISSINTEMRSGLLAAQKALEYQRLKTCWAIGKIINTCLAQNPDAAKIGNAFFKQVSEDLNRATDLTVAHDTLTRAVQFQKQYPVFPGETPLTFSHYLVLMRVRDPQERARFEQRAIKQAMSVTDMRREVLLLTHPCASVPSVARLAVQRGEPFIYALKCDSGVDGRKIVRIDCGFKILKNLPVPRMNESIGGRIVRTVKSGQGYQIFQNQRLRAKRYTYPAIVTRVIDGDTFDACVDVGFGIWINDRFRLRGINAPEIGDSEGRRAKIFLERLLEQCPRIIIRTTKEGMYGRWLADVFILEKEDDPQRIAEQGAYLNQVMMDEGMVQEY